MLFVSACACVRVRKCGEDKVRKSERERKEFSGLLVALPQGSIALEVVPARSSVSKSALYRT